MKIQESTFETGFTVVVDYTEMIDTERVLRKYLKDGIVTSYNLTYLDGKKIKYDVECISEEVSGKVLHALKR